MAEKKSYEWLKEELRTSSTIGPWETDEFTDSPSENQAKRCVVTKKTRSSSKPCRPFRVRKMQVSKLLEFSTIDLELQPEESPSFEDRMADAIFDGEKLCSNYFYGSTRTVPLRRFSTSTRSERSHACPSVIRNHLLEAIDIKVITSKLRQKPTKSEDPACVYTPPRSLRKASFRLKNIQAAVSSQNGLKL